MSRVHEHYELQLDEALIERGYHPDTQQAIWRLIGLTSISCETVLDMFSIVDEDPSKHAQDIEPHPSLF